MTDTLTAGEIIDLEILAMAAEISWSNPEICGRFHIALNAAYPALIAMAKQCVEQTEELDRANQICGHHLGDALFHQERAEKASAEIVALTTDRDKWIAASIEQQKQRKRAESEATRYREMAVRLANSLKAQQEAWAGNRTLAYLSDLLKICEEPDIAALLSEPKS